ncbi:unnamed protein product [Penicillium salamii]|nr:unnamed protein product [Penicillium salamii]CAG8321077.1 unnamed protein product [Penicillium salamii]
MLHGHGQSDESFECKTRFLQKTLEELFHATRAKGSASSRDVRFRYLSGPFPANPDRPQDGCRAWGYGDYKSERIKGIEESIRSIMHILEHEGPFVGIIGFSSGAALAAIVASLLEGNNKIQGLNFKIDHPPLSFVISFSGFRLESPDYQTVYYRKIETPILHVIGELDSMIEPSQTIDLANHCSNARIFKFFGCHYIPRNITHFPPFMGKFIRDALAYVGNDNEQNWVNVN